MFFHKTLHYTENPVKKTWHHRRKVTNTAEEIQGYQQNWKNNFRRDCFSQLPFCCQPRGWKDSGRHRIVM